jgi:hypothetical protein
MRILACVMACVVFLIIIFILYVLYLSSQGKLT